MRRAAEESALEASPPRPSLPCARAAASRIRERRFAESAPALAPSVHTTVFSIASRAERAAQECSPTTARPPEIFATATKPGTDFAAESLHDFGSPPCTGQRRTHATFIPGRRTSEANTA